MRNLIRTFILGLLLLPSNGAYAQSTLGLKAGISRTAWGGAAHGLWAIGTLPAADYEGTSFHVGGFLRSNSEAVFGAQIELLYSARQAKTDINGSITYHDGFVTHTQTVTGQDEIDLRYLELPCLMHVQVGEGLGLQAGGVLGILLNGRRTRDLQTTDAFSGSSSTSSVVDEDPVQMDDPGVLDIGVAFGVVYELEFGIGLGVRYSHGLTTTSLPSPFTTDIEPAEVHQRVLQGCIQYRFTRR